MFKFGVLIVVALYFLSGCVSSKKASAPAVTAPGTAATAAPAAPANKNENPPGIVCVNGSDSRSIEVVKANVCEVAYTKNSIREVVASSSSSFTHCNDVAKRIRGNLEAAGFSCKM